MDGSEDDALYDEFVGGPQPADDPESDDNDNDIYDDIPLSELQIHLLFDSDRDDSDDEFEGWDRSK